MGHDSKKLWLSVHRSIAHEPVTLGRASSAAYRSDPKMIAFIAARYKFVSKMLSGRSRVLEVGCGDGFGAALVGAEVGQLLATDIDSDTIADNSSRLRFLSNVSFEYFDFRKSRYSSTVDAAYAIDVIEHIFPEEESSFLANVAASLRPHAVAIFGTPNVTGEQYASRYSQAGHVNLKDYKALRETMALYFHNVFLFSMNDEVVHTGYYPMAHYLWALCVGPRVGELRGANER